MDGQLKRQNLFHDSPVCPTFTLGWVGTANETIHACTSCRAQHLRTRSESIFGDEITSKVKVALLSSAAIRRNFDAYVTEEEDPRGTHVFAIRRHCSRRSLVLYRRQHHDLVGREYVRLDG